MGKLTVSKLRDLIEYPTFVSDRTIIMELDADDYFRHKVQIAVEVDEENDVIFVTGGCRKLTVDAGRMPEAVVFCNNYNMEKDGHLAVCYDTDDHKFIALWSMCSKGASEECIIENLRYSIRRIRNFFIAADEEF